MQCDTRKNRVTANLDAGVFVVIRLWYALRWMVVTACSAIPTAHHSPSALKTGGGGVHTDGHGDWGWVVFTARRDAP